MDWIEKQTSLYQHKMLAHTSAQFKKIQKFAFPTPVMQNTNTTGKKQNTFCQTGQIAFDTDASVMSQYLLITSDDKSVGLYTNAKL